MFKKIKSFMAKHKIISGIVIIAAVFAGYKAYVALTTKAGVTQYALAAVQRGTIITSVTGSGQVSASTQIDLKAKASGNITYVGVNDGQVVKAGTLIASIDSADAQKAVRDAQVNLQSAKYSLEKLQQPADALSITQAQNALANAQQTYNQSQDDLVKAYDDALTAVSNAFLDFPTVVSGVSDVLYNYDYSIGQNNLNFYTDQVKDYNMGVFTYQNSADSDYQAAKAAYDENFNNYKATSRTADTSTIESLLNETYNTSLLLAQAAKSSDNFLGFVKDQLTQHNKNLPAKLATHQASIATYISTVNSNLSALLNSKNTIKNDKDAIVSAGLSVTEKQQSLEKLQSGSDPLDIASAKLSVQQRQNALLDAQQTFADYFTKAPFDGVIAKVDVKKADDVGSGTTIATIISPQQMATISLNEVDVAKVKIGQKVTMTFDAIDGLTLTGKVAEVDTIGTVSQGVVSYNVQISFDTQDARVKPGMSVNASIITNVKQDVLLVPSSAVKTQGTNSYVEMFTQPTTAVTGTENVTSASAPIRQAVTTGLSDDTNTEIVSGLNEGDMIVVKTIAATSNSSASQAPSLLQSLGGNNRGGVGGGAVRATGGGIPRGD